MGADMTAVAYPFDADKFPSCKKAHDYAVSLVSGMRVACQQAIQAAARYFADLERSKTNWPFRFDAEKAERTMFAVQLFEHYKGPSAGEKLILEPWQAFIYSQVFGWVNKKTGKRRFKRAYTEVPRGNGKSTMSSPLALYMLSMDGESGAEVYSAATTRDQARIVFRDAQFMARKAEAYRKRFGVEVHAHAISQLRTGSKFEPLSAEGDTLDGLNIHCVVIDELHAHKTRDVHDVLETGLGKRDQSLMWMITTAGSNLAGICMEVRGYVVKILNGSVMDDAVFGIVFTIDEGDDWKDPKSWEKANPNWGVSVMPEHVAQLAKKAMETPSAVAGFLTKHLNVWVNSDNPWLNMDDWNACADRSLKLADFEGEPCFVGLDLATKTDIAAKVRVFPRVLDNGKTHYYLFGEYYLPEAAVLASKNSQYQGWELEGLLTTTPGEVTDFGMIQEGIMDDQDAFDLREVAFDPWNATQLAQNLVEDGVEMIEFRMTVQNISEPMKEFEALVRSKRIHHDGNPVLTWMMSNVVCHVDNKENVFPKKENRDNKIDGAVASIMGLARAMFSDSDGAGSAYDDDDFWAKMEKMMASGEI